MNYFLLISAVCAALLTSSPGRAASPGKAAVAGLAIIQPPEKSIVQSGLLIVVLKGSTVLVDAIQLSVNNTKQVLSPKTFKQDSVCYDGIRLSYGLNLVKITGFKNNKKTEEITRQVFYQNDLSMGSISIPAGFKAYQFHVDENEKKCSSCHGLDFRKAEDPQDPLQSPCYLCHKKILSEYSFTHGPSAVWSCLMCHDRKAKKPKLAVAAPVAPICRGCHEITWEKMKYQHAPTASGACTTCHNPHAENRQYFLRKDTVELCASCHEEILSRPHVIVSFSGNSGHPLRNRPDPSRPGKNLTCASCHNPHGGNSSVFLNNYDDSMPMKRFCTSCHW
jgi:predicted CXXCH cytochrome family protein